jgi:hypothetical protein
VAANRLGRRGYSAEIIPEYYQLAKARLERDGITLPLFSDADQPAAIGAR